MNSSQILDSVNAMGEAIAKLEYSDDESDKQMEFSRFLKRNLSQHVLPKDISASSLDLLMMSLAKRKGPEEFTKIENAQAFADYYGDNIDFARHGQSLLTAASFVKAGGRLFARRVVAEDAKLANIAVIANVTKTNIQKTDENGKALYRDNATGEETTSSVASTPIMTQVADLEFTLQSVDMVSNNTGDYKTALKASHTHNGLGKDGSYPLFLFTDIGRGVSNKRIRIYRNNTTKYPIVYASYILKVMEENQDGTLTELETFMFSLNPDIRDSGLNMSLTRVVNAKFL